MRPAPRALACYALTAEGAALARRLAARLGHGPDGDESAAAPVAVDVFVPQRLQKDGEQTFDSLPLLVADTFARYDAHIFVGAAGIAVRSIAPRCTHKSSDPAVLACDERGRYAVSLLSGHWGGGNALALRVAEILGGEAVITTATDGRGLTAADVAAREAGCVILDWERVKLINGALLRGETVQLHDPAQVLDVPAHEPPGGGYARVASLAALDASRPAVCVEWRHVPPAENLLRLAVPALHVGVGCRRGVAAADIVQAVRVTLEQASLELRAVAGLASVQAKEDEPGLLEAARQLGVPLRFYSAEELAEAPVLTPSAMAAQIFGVERISVSEGAALLAAGGPGEEDAALLVPKTRHGACVTVAVAVCENMLPGNIFSSEDGA